MEGLKESINSSGSGVRHQSDSFSSVIIKRAVHNSREKSRDKSKGRSRDKSRDRSDLSPASRKTRNNRSSQAYVPVSMREEASRVRLKKISQV